MDYRKIAEKIKLLIGSKSVNQFCKETGLHQGNTSSFLSGKKYSISLDDLYSISNKYNLTLDYFVKDDAVLPTDIDSTILKEDTPEYIFIPFYDVKVSAGHGEISDSDRSRLMPIDRSFIMKLGYYAEELSVVEVAGDSMEPTLRSGDYVIVFVPHETVCDFMPGIYVIRDMSGLKVKRLDKDKFGCLIVMSDNSIYKPQIYTPEEEGTMVTIVGRVVSKLARM